MAIGEKVVGPFEETRFTKCFSVDLSFFNQIFPGKFA